MFGEAKLALVLGVGLVIAGAVVFFRKDIVQANSPADAIAPNRMETPDTDAKSATELRPRLAKPI